MSALKTRGSNDGTIIDSKRCLIPPVFTVPNQHPVSNIDELLDYDSAEVPGSQLNLRRQRLSLNEDSSSEQKGRIEYGERYKRQKYENDRDEMEYERHFSSEEASSETVSQRTEHSLEENLAHQSSSMDSFDLDMAIKHWEVERAESSPVCNQSCGGACFAADTGMCTGCNKSISTESVSDPTSLEINSSPFCVSLADAAFSSASLCDTSQTSVTSTPPTAAPSIPAFHHHLDEYQVWVDYSTQVDREPACSRHDTVPVDDVTDLMAIAGSAISLHNSLSSSVSQQGTVGIVNPSADVNPQANTSISELGFDYSHSSDHSSSSSSDQQVPLSSEDEMENHLMQRQLRSCTDQTVPNRDIEE